MTLKPYPAISRIAAVAARAGHVVGVEDGKTIVETGTRKIVFGKDRQITDADGKTYSMDEAIAALGITL